jgi:hypothetical protein
MIATIVNTKDSNIHAQSATLNQWTNTRVLIVFMTKVSLM